MNHRPAKALMWSMYFWASAPLKYLTLASDISLHINYTGILLQKGCASVLLSRQNYIFLYFIFENVQA